MAPACASEDLCADRILVLEAVKQRNAEALEYASEELRLDPVMRYIAGADVTFLAATDEMLP